MNGTDFREGSSGFVFGKEFVIVITVVFSALSFALGYFVGRASAPQQSPSPIGSALQVPQEPTYSAQTTPPAQSQQEADPAPAAPSVESGFRIAEPAPAKPEPNSAPAPTEAAHAASEYQQSRITHRDEKTGKSSAKPVYTVQVGAFMSTSEASKLKQLCEKKGFKAYIVPDRQHGGATVYKVRTGEFAVRKDAEILALRLKKAEGLTAFVTSRTE